MSITIWIIVITAAVSIYAFERRDIFEKLLLSPYMVVHRKEWYRIFSHGFVHADWFHLIINMFVLFSFGQFIESAFKAFSEFWMFHFLILYFGGMAVASISTILKHKDNYAYRSVGASGAVSAIVFACIFFDPWNPVLLMAVLPIPGIIFGVLYLVYSSYMSKKGGDNINHDAHMYGALFGLVYPLIMEPKLFPFFIQMLTHPHF